MKRTHNSAKKAFTLIELAVVIIIIGLIGGMGLSASQDMIENANRAATENKMDVIEKALLVYWQKNGRLPCPANGTLATSNASFGLEATSNTPGYNCAAAPSVNFYSATNIYKASEGVVPVVTLGLPRDFLFDGWKRKFAYAVTPQFVNVNAAARIPPKASTCVANTALRVKDVSGADRSTSAAYVLLSYGKNGHGGYPATGSTRYNAGSTNTDEQTNCHCNNLAADATYDGDYVQRSQNLNETTAANYFDDIVRYKERWQLTTPDDVITFDNYTGPDLAVGYVEPTNGTAYVYKNQCGAFVKQANLSPAPTNEVRGIAYTAGNKHLLVYSGLGCNLYKINNDGTLTNLPTAFATVCPYSATAVMELSNNGYLAISAGSASDIIYLWKQAGDTFTKIANLTHSAASVLGLSFSKDAKMLAVRSATTTSVIYKRKGNDIFSSAAADITQPPSLSSIGTPSEIKFSPDGKYLISMEYWAAKTASTVNGYRIASESNPTFIRLQEFVPSIGATVNSFMFSADGKYMASDLNASASAMCRLNQNDSLCGLLWWNNATSYYYALNMANSMETVDDVGNAQFAVNKVGDLIVTRAVANNVPEVMRKTTGNLWINKNNIFDASGLPGSTPVRAVDQVLSGSSGGPIAFPR